MNDFATPVQKEKLVFFGLDGGDPDLIMQWIASGDLPHLSRLYEHGIMIPCCANDVEGDGAAWISLATASSVGRHGVYFTEQMKPGTYALEPVNEDRACVASTIWRRLDTVGINSIIVDMFRAPLSKDFKGTQINDWLSSYRTSLPRSTPNSAVKRLIEQYGDDPFHGNCDKWFNEHEDFDKLLELCLSRIKKKTDAIKEMAKSNEWDLLVLGYADAHDISHMCWHLHARGHLGEDSAGDPVKQVYKSIDGSIGEILAAMPQRVHVFVFAGTGFCTHLLDSILMRIEDATDRLDESVIDTVGNCDIDRVPQAELAAVARSAR
jgi:predicted AlkP superfamily phosphohydrolase/phosphomutase